MGYEKKIIKEGIYRKEGIKKLRKWNLSKKRTKN